MQENVHNSSWGGRRPGSGRKAEQYTVSFTCRLSPEQRQYLAAKYGKVSEGIRQLVEQDMVQQDRKQP